MKTFNIDVCHYFVKKLNKAALLKPSDFNEMERKYNELGAHLADATDFDLMAKIVAEHVPVIEEPLRKLDTSLRNTTNKLIDEVIERLKDYPEEELNLIMGNPDLMTTNILGFLANHSVENAESAIESKDDNVLLDVRFEVTGSREEAEACIAEIMECAAEEGLYGEVVDFRPVNVVTTNLENEALVEPAEAGYTAPQQVPDSITVRTTHVEETVISAPPSALITDPAVLAGSAVRTNIE